MACSRRPVRSATSSPNSTRSARWRTQVRALTLITHQRQNLDQAARPLRRPRAELGGLAGLEHKILVAKHEPEAAAEHVDPFVPLVRARVRLPPLEDREV